MKTKYVCHARCQFSKQSDYENQTFAGEKFVRKEIQGTWSIALE